MKIWMCHGPITLWKIDEICPLAISKQISTISMHIPSLVKIHWHLLKLSSWKEKSDLLWADNSVKNWQNLPISNPKPDSKRVKFCVEVLRPSQSAVSLPNHTVTGQALSSKRLTSIVQILLPETDNCPSWISGRERMTVENISWSISTKECCWPRRGLNPRPPGLQSDAHPTEPPRPALKGLNRIAAAEYFKLRVRTRAQLFKTNDVVS